MGLRQQPIQRAKANCVRQRQVNWRQAMLTVIPPTAGRNRAARSIQTKVRALKENGFSGYLCILAFLDGQAAYKGGKGSCVGRSQSQVRPLEQLC
ncbi:hypothetical protein TNCT_167021 [Trichonephila clavata]|uniref:Uncharacterized protein n=1 Tax=Trichonephila clavata TaxID=2740835 RepID=A0A8X6GXH4_TRICU|nr:hypothetical protein TNCT_167021 [Trichonephila clavata]